MKPRSDSKLKGLPEERQEQIIAWAKTPKSDGCSGGLAHAQEQLAADGMRVALSTLSDFVSWWHLRQRFALANSRAQQVEELLKSKDPSMSPERIRELGQAIFTMEAVDSGDAETFVNLEHLKLKQDSAKFKGELDLAKYHLDREKFETETCKKFLLWFKDAKAREIADSGLSNAQKIAALRAEYFKDVDALEKSGGVKLPD